MNHLNMYEDDFVDLQMKTWTVVKVFVWSTKRCVKCFLYDFMILLNYVHALKCVNRSNAIGLMNDSV